jgi:hypothetical protein
MPGMIVNFTNVTLSNVTGLGNVSSYAEFAVKVNTIVYAGWLFFLLLCLVWIITFLAANKVRDQPLNNMMYSGALVTILSLVIRGVEASVYGVSQALLTDHLLWVFPILTLVLVIIVWATKD